LQLETEPFLQLSKSLEDSCEFPTELFYRAFSELKDAIVQASDERLTFKECFLREVAAMEEYGRQ